MKTAKEMFEELNWKYIIDKTSIIYKYDCGDQQRAACIVFNHFTKSICCISGVYDQKVNTFEFFIRLGVLAAINKQVEELGWNNEEM